MMTSLTKLQLGNNIIEKIENLDSLVNLRELDLSFNHIKVIENLDKLVKLEILSLFQNLITELKNIDSLKNLRIFSIGNNLIENWDCILDLRKFTELKSLNFAGNPCANDDFRAYVIAFIPQLVYYEYKLITPEETQSARDVHIKALEQLEREEEEQRKLKDKIAKAAEKQALHSEAYIEHLEGDQLYDALFENDAEGQAFLLMGEEAEEINETFKQQVHSVSEELFKFGQEQLELRNQEIEQFTVCSNEAKEKIQKESQKIMEEFILKKTDIFIEMTKLQAQSLGKDLSDNEHLDHIIFKSSEFTNLCQKTWKSLMGLEMTLFDQLEELNSTFERNLGDMVNYFIESAQGFFTQMREHENTFSELLNDQAQRFLTHLTIRNEDLSTLPPALRPLIMDKETVNSAIVASHDIHLQVIDNREDLLMSRIRIWHRNLCANIHKEEVTRNRTTVLEINHFLDIQREEFDFYFHDIGEEEDEEELVLQQSHSDIFESSFNKEESAEQHTNTETSKTKNNE